MTVQTIIKNAVKRLEREGKLLTPDFYQEAFCKEAKIAGMISEDCTHLDKFSQSLNKEFQKDLKQYRIKTMSEFSRFIISKLNRTTPSQCAQSLEAQTVFIKRVLQVVSVLHNKEASDLAQKSIKLLESSPTVSQIDQFRQHWVNFITTYDDTFLSNLKAFGEVDSSNLRATVEKLNTLSISGDNMLDSMELSKISSLLVASLVPSIASSVNEQIATLSQKIKRNPELLDSASVLSEVKAAILLRIALDKNSVKEMVESLDGVLDKLSLRLIDMIESSDNSTIEIRQIKHDLEDFNDSSASDFKTAHKKLFTIASALEKNTQLLSNDLKSHSGDLQALGSRIRKLEEELASAKQDSKEDFLTKLYNKRALDEFMDIKEAEFKRYNRNYSVAMFDLDLFKDVNDTYGHDAGDAVLAAFAKILKNEARSVDIVGRFGGEEFVALLSETDTKGGAMFADKVRKKVQKARFMYKGERIRVTVSAGVSERKKHISLKNTLNSSDEYLYKAKNDGRNQVAYKK